MLFTLNVVFTFATFHFSAYFRTEMMHSKTAHSSSTTWRFRNIRISFAANPEYYSTQTNPVTESFKMSTTKKQWKKLIDSLSYQV